MYFMSLIRNNFRDLIMRNQLKVSQRCFSSVAPSQDELLPINYEAVAENDADLVKKLKIIALEVDILRQEGRPVPSRISDDRWRDLLGQETRSQRLKLLNFWFLNEKKRENDLKRKEKRQQLKRESEAERKKSEEVSGHIKYGIGGSTLFLRIYDSTIDRCMNSKLINAMMFGEKVVIDCGYDEHMTYKEANNCAKQLSYLFAENRMHRSPFDLHFCNVDRAGPTMTRLQKLIPTMYDPSFPLNVHEKSYLELFPKERLVYLTPHCREEMRSFNSDDVYIVGAMVDKRNNEPLSLAKAKAQGLRMAKFPLDRYLSWELGSKSLTLNQVVNILLDLKETGDWHEAFNHVPTRKLKLADNVFPNKRKLKISSLYK